MAKTNNNKRKNKAKARLLRPRSLVPSDQLAFQRYVELLANPCTGPLVHGPGSNQGGQVTRFEKDFIFGNGATGTAGMMVITPGAINNQAGAPRGCGVLQAEATTDGSALTLNGTNASALAYVPGATFLTSQCSNYRCLAACVQLYWPGSELNRQGIVSGAQATYGLHSTAANSTNCAVNRAVSPVVERMPSDFMEIKWAPNYADGLFRSPSSASAPEDGHSSMMFTFGGLPVATGVRVRVVCVYEWVANAAGDVVLSSNTSPQSMLAHSLQQARAYLDSRDANWWNKTGMAAVNFLSGVTVAYAARRARAFPRIEL